MMTLVLGGGDQRLWWMDGRWQYHSGHSDPHTTRECFFFYCMHTFVFVLVCVYVCVSVSVCVSAWVLASRLLKCQQYAEQWRPLVVRAAWRGRDRSLTSSWPKGWRPAPAGWRPEPRRWSRLSSPPCPSAWQGRGWLPVPRWHLMTQRNIKILSLVKCLSKILSKNWQFLIVMKTNDLQ